MLNNVLKKLSLIIAVAPLVFIIFPVGAQQQKELLQEINPERAESLEEYNSIFLKEVLYFASRHRIVKADVNLLRQERDITITPFDDVAPIVIKYQEMKRNGEDTFFWRGKYENDPTFDRFGVSLIPVIISMHAWDLDESGNALNSKLNRFTYSPLWTFGENNEPILETSAGNRSESMMATTPPPQTQEEIERHKRLKKLDKHAFFSVSAVLSVPGGSKYVLKPLKYTPKYSVIYEITRDTIIPIQIDRMPGEPKYRDANEKAVAERYLYFINSLTKEDEDKKVRGDIQ